MSQNMVATVRNLFNLVANSWGGCSDGILQFVLFTVSWFKWPVKKHWVAKVSLAIWEIFLQENNRNYVSLSYEFNFILFMSFLANHKQKSCFLQVGGLVTRNISVFCL